MLKGVAIKAKAEGKGVTVSTKPIAPDDLQMITEYFRHNHMQKPKPKILQRTVLFYIIYYFSCRGRENLYTMQTDTFKGTEDPNRNEHIYQFQGHTCSVVRWTKWSFSMGKYTDGSATGPNGPFSMVKYH